MPHFRAGHRSALLAAALIAGGPLLLPAVAHAQPEASGRQITFGGAGLFGVSCEAIPDTGSVTVAAETTLLVVNHTGYRATLLLDGAPRGEIASGGVAEVLFHRGPVELALEPHCMFPEESPVRVQVIPVRPSPRTVDSGSPAAPSPTTGRGTPSARGSASGGGSPTAGSAVLGRAPSRGGASEHRPPPRDRADAATNDAPQGGLDKVPSEEPDAPASEATDTVLLPGDPPQDGAPTPKLAAEPMASVEPVGEDDSIGLLAIIATVCVLGVSIGAIRAILSERASRASVA